MVALGAARNRFREPAFPPSTAKSPVDIRAYELDTIAAFLLMERRDELAELLTDHDWKR